MNYSVFARSVGAIYEAASVPQRWPAALKQLETAFGCSSAKLVDRDLDTMLGRGVGFDEVSYREYFEVWRHRNVLATTTPAWRLGTAVTDRQVLPRSDLLCSDYYNGFLKPRDSHSFLMLSFGIANGVHTTITLTRPRSAEEHDARELEFARELLPHLKRALTIGRNLRSSNLVAAAATELLEQNPTGIVLLDSTGRSVFANRAAQAMAEKRDSFSFRAGRIEALRPHDDATLQILIRSAVVPTSGATLGIGGMMRLARKTGLRDYAIVTAPLAIDSGLFDAFAPVACVLISDPDKTPLRPATMIKRLYGLTSMEAKVAARLLTGESPEQVAQALEIKISTTRAHLAALFRKTETTRQTELIRLLLSLPWSHGATKQ